MSLEQVDLMLTRLHPRQPVARIDGTSGRGQWWISNAAGHRRLLEAAGFDVLRSTGVYLEPLGEAHPSRRGGAAQLRGSWQSGCLGAGRACRTRRRLRAGSSAGSLRGVLTPAPPSSTRLLTSPRFL